MTRSQNIVSSRGGGTKVFAMWRTSCGDRVLSGAEAKVFAEALLNLLDEEAQARIRELRKLCDSVIRAS
jgi:hypothetical protein